MQDFIQGHTFCNGENPMHLPKLYYLFLPVLLSAIVGCNGSGVGLDDNGNLLNSENENPSQPSTGNVSATLVDIQSKVFTKSCALSGCHSGPSAPLGLRLDEDVAFDLLVNKPSQQQPQLLRIKAGDPDNSYIIQKLEGTAASGLQMPRNRNPLSVETIQAIRKWIEEGAIGPRLSSIQANVFTPICTQCHLGTSPAGGLNLEEGQSYANLVGKKRLFDPEIRVVAGNADTSFIIDKLENNNLGGSRGDQMPLGGPFLEEQVIDVIRQWINDGAKDN